jgi:hypothetical protein
MTAQRPQPVPRAPGFRPPVVTARGGESGLTYRSTQAHVQYWMADDIAVEIGAERLLAAHSAWRTLAKGGLPRLCDVLESDAHEADPDMLLYLKLDDDYLVVAQGADRMRHIGRDLRGRTMSGFTQSVGVVLKELYDTCFTKQTAIYARFVTDLASDDSIYWEGLFLPLMGEDGGSTRFLASYATPIDHKTDVLQMVLDRSPTGTIVAVPVGTGRGGRLDGRIILINACAKKILKFDEKGSRVNYIRDLAPWLRNVAGWTRVNVTVEGRQTRVQYRDRDSRNYLVTIESLNRFILFGIIEGNGEILAPPREDAPYSSGASTIGS